MIDLRQMQAVAAIASEGSIMQAAQRLGWSQPTVQHHIRNLERLLGATVLVRGARGSTLTPVGALILERAENILSLTDRALSDARELAHLDRIRLRFGIFPSAAAKLLPQITKRLAHIGVELDVMVEEVDSLATWVNQQSIDAALMYVAEGYDTGLRPHITIEHLQTDPMYIAVSTQHPLASRAALTTDSLLTLAEERWVTGLNTGGSLDPLLRDTFSSRGLTLNVTQRTDDYAVMLSLVQAGLAIAFMPEMLPSSPPGGVAMIPLTDTRFRREIYLASPASAIQLQPVLRHLQNALHRAFTSGADHHMDI